MWFYLDYQGFDFHWYNLMVSSSSIEKGGGVSVHFLSTVLREMLPSSLESSFQ